METLTKVQKIATLSKAMTRSERDDKTEFYHFTDNAPEELKDLYLEHYEVRNIDYETFSSACDMLSDIYYDYVEENTEHNEALAKSEIIIDQIYERSADSASVYTADRLSYLNIWNQDEISDYIKNGIAEDIQTACAIWYDAQVEQASLLINEWVNA